MHGADLDGDVGTALLKERDIANDNVRIVKRNLQWMKVALMPTLPMTGAAKMRVHHCLLPDLGCSFERSRLRELKRESEHSPADRQQVKR